MVSTASKITPIEHSKNLATKNDKIRAQQGSTKIEGTSSFFFTAKFLFFLLYSRLFVWKMKEQGWVLILSWNGLRA